MKRGILIRLFLITLIISSVLFACRKELLVPPDNSVLIESEKFADKNIRLWFESSFSNSGHVKTHRLHKFDPARVFSEQEQLDYGIDWEEATTFFKNDSTVVEVPLTDTTSRQTIANHAKSPLYKNSITKLLIIRTPSRIRAVLMTIISDEQVSRDRLSEEVSLLKKKRSFNGVVIYQDMGGAFLGGYKYKNGRPDARIGMDAHSVTKRKAIKSWLNIRSHAISIFYRCGWW